jgi:hypothetical protein
MYSSTHSLIWSLDGGEWSASRPGRFTPRERNPGTHWIGGWVDLRAVLDAVVKRKIPSPRRESNPRTPIVQVVAQSLYRLSYHGSSFLSKGVIYNKVRPLKKEILKCDGHVINGLGFKICISFEKHHTNGSDSCVEIRFFHLVPHTFTSFR